MSTPNTALPATYPARIFLTRGRRPGFTSHFPQEHKRAGNAPGWPFPTVSPDLSARPWICTSSEMRVIG